MSRYQFSPLKDEKEFEFLVNDLCKEEYGIEFQVYGRKGQKQDGIDGLSFSKKLIVYQCKNKFINRDDKKIQEELLNDIETEVKSAIVKFQNIDTFIFANSFKQDTKLQNKALELTNSYNLKVLVWSWEEIENLLEKHPSVAKQYYPELFNKNILSENDIKLMFQENSQLLLTSINYYIENIFIDVPEIEKITDFIDSNADENILVLTGKAGIGKTAILSNIQSILAKGNAAFLSIKSDQFEIDSKESLSNFFGVDDILLSIKKLARKEQVIVLIDQLDALSLTMSSNRKVINIILEFIEQLKNISNVKIIVSIREYDLKNDPLFKSLNSKNIIYTKLLDYKYVENRLKSFVKESKKITKTLIELLRTPLHLSILIELYPYDNSCISIKTLQDLYNKFWEQKIQDKSLDRDLRKNILKLLSSMVYKMSESSKIEIPKVFFEDEFNDEISILLSKNILKEENKKISFFHQTFYDYIFARDFVKNSQSLYEYLLTTTQNLAIREQVKQIIQFLRGTDEDIFIKEIENIIYSNKVRFHLKLLLISYLGNLEQPTDEEFAFIQKLFSDKPEYEKYFIESWISSDWLKYLNKICFFNDENFKKYNLENKLEIFINKEPELLFDILDNCECQDEIKNIAIVNCFNRLDNFNKISVKTLKKYSFLIFKENTIFYELIEFYKKLYKLDKAYAINLFFNFFNKKIEIVEEGNEDALLVEEWYEIFEFLVDQNNITILKSFLESIQKISEKYKYSIKEHIITDTVFYLTTHTDIYINNTLSFYLKMLEIITKLSKNNKELFLNLIKPYQETNYISLITFLIYGYYENPKEYKKEILKLFTDIKLLEEINFSYNPGHKLLLLLRKSFPLFDKIEQKEIFNTIINVNPTWQKTAFIGKSGKKPVYRGTYKGLKKYELLYQLKIDDIKRFGYIKEFKELKRKFPWYKFDKPLKSEGGVISAPLESHIYSKMSLNNWIQSMKVFDGIKKRTSNNILKGNIIEHSRKFEKEVKNNPDKFYNFLILLKSEKIHPKYLSAGLNGLIASQYNEDKVLKIIHLYSDINHNWLKRAILKAIKYLISKNKYDTSILDFLETNKNIKYEGIAKQENKFQSIDDQTLRAINSYQGEYAELLPLIYKQVSKDKFEKKRILKLINELINHNTNFVIFGLLRTLGVIADIDKSLFTSLLTNVIKKDKTGQITIYSLQNIQYLYVNNLISENQLIIFMKKCTHYIKLIQDKEDTNYINQFGIYLYYYYIHLNNNYFEKLLNNATKSNKQVIHGALKQIAEQELQSSSKKSIEIAKQFILKYMNSKESKHFYRFKLVKMNGLNFIQNDFEFIKALTSSIHIKTDVSNFIEYLKNEYYADTNIADKIFELLKELIQQINSFEEPNYINSKPLIEFILELNTRTKSNETKIEILDLIDSFLKSDKLRYNTKSAIE